jgi:hypothetical protein
MRWVVDGRSRHTVETIRTVGIRDGVGSDLSLAIEALGNPERRCVHLLAEAVDAWAFRLFASYREEVKLLLGCRV